MKKIDYEKLMKEQEERNKHPREITIDRVIIQKDEENTIVPVNYSNRSRKAK